MANRLAFESLPAFSEKNIIVKGILKEVFQNLKKNFKDFQKVTDQDFVLLHSLFGETLKEALEIVEKNKVTYYYLQKSNIGIYQTLKMNNREDWRNLNPYVEQFMYPTSVIQNTSLNPNSSNWVHAPPQTMPWGTQTMSQPSIIRFTAGDFNRHSTSIKRKCEQSPDVLPAKILVTEEKMAAHMKSLHISDFEVEPQNAMTNVSCNEESMETERLPKLILSDEIKYMKTDPIIPESILKRLEKPEMALVLWQPSPAHLDSKFLEQKKVSDTKEDDSENEKENGMDVKNKKMEVKCKEDKFMDVALETEDENSVNSIFRPINPVPMSSMQPQYIQPVPQFNEYSSYHNSSDTFLN